eukprot:m.752407 g.752407  ORF g.752407 m.752407 type:complete len:290 (-) comp23169_c0_seq16:78-947(-)
MTPFHARATTHRYMYCIEALFNAFFFFARASTSCISKNNIILKKVRVIVLRGNGEHFSSGHDLGTKEHSLDLQQDSYTSMGYPGPSGHYKMWSDLDVEMCLRWRQLSKPLIIGIQGYCIYHACAVMSCGDIVIAADNAKFMPSLVEVTTLPWDLALNTKKVKEILMMQRFILSHEAERLGLVNKVVEGGKLDTELQRLASIVAKGDPFHLRMMKQAANSAQDNAGYTAHIRSSLSHWMSYRWQWTEHQRMHPTRPDRLAPVQQALGEDIMSWSRAAKYAQRHLQIEGSK